jgi:enoyl-CoA hydratase/carnithine racemase
VLVEVIAMSGDDVLFERHGAHVAILTINRPQKRNAVNASVTALMHRYIAQTEQDQSIRVVILTGAGEKAFCAGADLAELVSNTKPRLHEDGFAAFTSAYRAKPWIAAVRGAAAGGGTEIALACDMIIAAESASFSLPEVKRGLIAAAGGVYRLPRALPRGIALEMIATGAPITAQRAYSLGFVSRLVPDEMLMEGGFVA